jgi:hypothetical protein
VHDSRHAPRYDELVMRLRWHTALVLLLVWLLAACGGQTRRDYGTASGDAGSAPGPT